MKPFILQDCQKIILYSQRHSMINHWDRHSTLLGDSK
jgi:hypothetical protein